MVPRVLLHPWSATDLDLLRRKNTPAMMAHLGGPESEEQLIARHERYLRLTAEGTAFMFRVTVPPSEEAAGSVGYWERGDDLYETGWAVLPEYQGRGVAVAATLAAARRAAEFGDRRWLHAYPSVENLASNAVCRKAGFELLGPEEFEYPPGHLITSNNWRLDLHTLRMLT